MSEQTGIAIKTGTNQAVPISFYKQWLNGSAPIHSSSSARTVDDCLAEARALVAKQGREKDVISLTTKILAVPQVADAYFLRAYAKSGLGDRQGALADYAKTLAINPGDLLALSNRAKLRFELGDKQGAIAVGAGCCRSSCCFAPAAEVVDPGAGCSSSVVSVAVSTLQALVL